MTTIASAASRRRERLAGVLLPALEGVFALVLTAILVVWLIDFALSNISLEGLTLNILIRGSDPFRGMDTQEALWLALRRSAALLFAAIVGALLAGVGAGVFFAFAGSRAARGLAWTLGTAGIALPSFFWAMLLQLGVVAVYLRTGAQPFPVAGFGLDEHLLLPAIALGARPAAYLFRTTATALDEARHGDYVRFARAKGLLEGVILSRHILPNAAPAVLGGLGLAARSALSSLAIVEYVFTWNGAGFAFIHSVATGNVPFATALAVAFAVLFGLVGIGVAGAARLFDPRAERA